MPSSNRARPRDAVWIDDLWVRYDGSFALEQINIVVHAGEAVGIIGPNGSGKSTLLKTIAGLLAPARGTVEVFGKPPRSLPPGSIAYVPQVEVVDWSFPATVWDVVAMARFAHLRPWQPFSADDRSLIARALEATRMADLASRPIADLSGGQQQRAFMARAIAQEPKLLLLDEPTSGVDASTEDVLAKLIRSLAADGLPVLMATHDLERAEDFFDYLVLLDRRCITYGRPSEVLASKEFRRVLSHGHHIAGSHR
ncbi:MAG: hypothetical protein DLM50_02900 [Candidatus Meridianibacter frigidus]|nr:MAG: hypothetical protein DLM50_02900 [Candidatus Eremiobacteraeota bacterium]